VFVVDSADIELMPTACAELHLLLKQPLLRDIPLLVLGNKADLQDSVPVEKLVEALNLEALPSTAGVSCYGVSVKEEANLDAVISWIITK
jgi:signal recognition particle receptor subunit beta